MRRLRNSLVRWCVSRESAVKRETMRSPERQRTRVLVIGIYLADRANTSSHLVERFARTPHLDVDQKWIAINGNPGSDAVAGVTVERIRGFEPKFAILNRVLPMLGWEAYDFVVISDDDIVVPEGFLDRFIRSQLEFDLALAQPARTRTSHADHEFVRQRTELRGRQTRFVEIGPLLSIRWDLAREIIPFDETSPMGWGYDFVWPTLVESRGLKMGIIDSIAVDHSLRGLATTYDKQKAIQDMHRLLDRYPHLTRRKAFTVIREFR